MAILLSQDSAEAIEKRKWESQHTEAGPPGRPYAYHPYPAMLYKAGRIKDGPLGIIETRIVDNEQQAKNLSSEGFCVGPHEAIAYVEAQQLEFAKLAAERNYEKKNKLSPRAAAEVEAAENARGSEHLPTIPETAIPPRPQTQPSQADILAAARERANRVAKSAAPDQGENI